MISRRKPRSLRRDGMSLLEVLLSMTIFLFSIVAIAGLVDFGASRGQAAAFQNAGTRLAKSKLAEVEAGVIDVYSGGSGSFEVEPEWSWSVESEATSVPNLYQVTVRVFRDLSGQRFEVSLSQMILDSTLLGSGAPAEPPTAGES